MRNQFPLNWEEVLDAILFQLLQEILTQDSFERGDWIRRGYHVPLEETGIPDPFWFLYFGRSDPHSFDGTDDLEISSCPSRLGNGIV